MLYVLQSYKCLFFNFINLHFYFWIRFSFPHLSYCSYFHFLLFLFFFLVAYFFSVLINVFFFLVRQHIYTFFSFFHLKYIFSSPIEGNEKKNFLIVFFSLCVLYIVKFLNFFLLPSLLMAYQKWHLFLIFLFYIKVFD